MARTRRDAADQVIVVERIVAVQAAMFGEYVRFMLATRQLDALHVIEADVYNAAREAARFALAILGRE